MEGLHNVRTKPATPSVSRRTADTNIEHYYFKIFGPC